MSPLFELWNTSAPRGLKPGSVGFCTVKCSQGMPINLVERLEMLSGYRHLFPPTGELAHQNPIVYAHYRITLGGIRYHVLSRVANAGLDYSGRSNRFAHHLVLSADSLPPSGPAWLLQQPGVMETAWDGRIEIIRTRRVLPVMDIPPAPCKYWESLTGDAGFAATLLEAFLTTPPKTVCILAPVGVDILKLFGECIALLPPPLRWDVTFTTFFVGLPPEVECIWRGVIVGTPEADAARRRHGLLLLDLTTKSLPHPRDQKLVEAARQGCFALEPIPTTELQPSPSLEQWTIEQPTPTIMREDHLSPLAFRIPPTPEVPKVPVPQARRDYYRPVPLPPALDKQTSHRKRFFYLLTGTLLGAVLISLVLFGAYRIAWQVREIAERGLSGSASSQNISQPIEAAQGSKQEKPSENKGSTHVSEGSTESSQSGQSEALTSSQGKEFSENQKGSHAQSSGRQDSASESQSPGPHPAANAQHETRQKDGRTGISRNQGTFHKTGSSEVGETGSAPPNLPLRDGAQEPRTIYAEAWEISSPPESAPGRWHTQKHVPGDLDFEKVTLELILWCEPRPRETPTQEESKGLTLKKESDPKVWRLTDGRGSDIGRITLEKQPSSVLQLTLELTSKEKRKELLPYLLEISGPDGKIITVFQFLQPAKWKTAGMVSPPTGATFSQDSAQKQVLVDVTSLLSQLTDLGLLQSEFSANITIRNNSVYWIHRDDRHSNGRQYAVLFVEGLPN